MNYSVVKKDIAAQPVLLVRRRIKQSEIAAALSEMFPQVMVHVLGSEIEIAGPLFARYADWSDGMTTIEAGVPISNGAAGSGDLIADSLPGGSVAMTIHEGQYDDLPAAHAAVQQWMKSEGLSPVGAPWESYITDPGQHPDPKDWKTEVYFPVR